MEICVILAVVLVVVLATLRGVAGSNHFDWLQLKTMNFQVPLGWTNESGLSTYYPATTRLESVYCRLCHR
jgi:hypothetical protein